MRTSIVKGDVYWVSTEVGVPASNVPVLIQVASRPTFTAGVAFYSGDSWHTYMKPDHPELDEFVEWWAPLPN